MAVRFFVISPTHLKTITYLGPMHAASANYSQSFRRNPETRGGSLRLESDRSVTPSALWDEYQYGKEENVSLG